MGTWRTWPKTLACALIVCSSVLATGCSDDTDSPTSPTPTTPTAAEPTIVEEFIGTVRPEGATFYSFTVNAYGTVNITYTAVSGAGVPGTAWLGLALGTPAGEDCAISSTVNTAPGSSPQITGAYQPAVYCVRVADIGNLFAPANFAVTIAHP